MRVIRSSGQIAATHDSVTWGSPSICQKSLAVCKVYRIGQIVYIGQYVSLARRAMMVGDLSYTSPTPPFSFIQYMGGLDYI